MTPAELIAALIEKSGKSLTNVADDIAGRSFQGTLYKFVHLGTKSPRRETVARIAKHFGLPPEALFDNAGATKAAAERGLIYRASAPPPTHVANEPIPMPTVRAKTTRGLPPKMLDRIGQLNSKQLKALEHMIESYLDTVAPTSERAKKHA